VIRCNSKNLQRLPESPLDYRLFAMFHVNVDVLLTIVLAN